VHDDLVGASTVDETVDEWYRPDDLAACARSPDHGFFVAENVEETTVVGFAHVAPSEEDWYWLSRIYVHPDEWGQGIGGRFLGRAEADLRERGVARLRLTVVADNEVGVGFYESHGFECREERPNEALGVREYVYEKEV
jgi:GNAT superfamily N-acetyltransferase